MAGVGEEGGGIAEIAVDRLGHDECGVERNADRERLAETGGRVNMGVTMTVRMAVVVATIMRMIAMVMVMMTVMVVVAQISAPRSQPNQAAL
ncbi:hypothetical protein GCM10010987_33660 [Bradyrhizobium guangdongense]|uniref:Uncharacterized protein n=1 Tax=Bradyrhizobium guangdongense TaxID=1325090 RepID=A0AA87W9D3_9BRAD|nr:hypothetical protein GCM10010987_33660 [Bradyrhizobium guangdongense]